MSNNFYVENGYTLSSGKTAFTAYSYTHRLHVNEGFPTVGYNLPGAAGGYITGFYLTAS
jgi:hypothetical protein